MTDPQRFQPVPPPPDPAASDPAASGPAAPNSAGYNPWAAPPAPAGSPPGGHAASNPAPYLPPMPPPQQPYGGYPPQQPYGGYPPQQPYGGYPSQYGAPSAAKPSNNIGWAIASIFLFWPVAIPAFIFALRVDPAWQRGDRAGAVAASGRARMFGIIGVVLGVLIAIGYVAGH